MCIVIGVYMYFTCTCAKWSLAVLLLNGPTLTVFYCINIHVHVHTCTLYMYIYCACVICTYNGVLTTLLHGTVQYKDGQYNGIKVIAI